jgi:undecaprenyl-diphosphatase
VLRPGTEHERAATATRSLFDRVAIGYSALGNNGLLWIACGVAVAVATDHVGAVVSTTAIVWATLVLNFVIKRVVRRSRPVARGGRVPLIRPPTSPSFPSSHSAMAAAGAIALSLDAPGLWPLFATLAIFMAASRVYLVVHHVSDVVAGLAVGACTGAALALLVA